MTNPDSARGLPEAQHLPSETQDIASLPLDHTPEIELAITIVRQAALLARRIQAEMIGSSGSASPALSKNDRSPVTVADFAIQALVSRRLMTAFPADSLVAEEDSSALRGTPLLDQVTAFLADLLPEATPAVMNTAEVMNTAQAVCAWIDRGRTGEGGTAGGVGAGRGSAPTDRYWLLDPIDGTKGFLRGGQYVVALALMVDGQVQIGVLGCPELSLIGLQESAVSGSVQAVEGNYTAHRPSTGPVNGSLVIAARGQGTWATKLDRTGAAQGTYVRLHVSDRGDPAQARLLRSFEAGHTNVDQIEQFAAALGIGGKDHRGGKGHRQTEPVLMDSQAKYAVLAAGQGDLILRLLSPEKPDYREKAWDQAAGSLVVEEAGGRATDLSGKPFDFSAGRELIHNRGVLVSNGRLHEAALLALKAIGA